MVIPNRKKSKRRPLNPTDYFTAIHYDDGPAAAGAMADSLLEARDIHKSYDGAHALRGASFELRAGEIHALIGENGAGKSTLIKVFTGAVRAEAGELRFAGRRLIHNTPAIAKSLGIAAIYQQPSLFPELTVAENICFAMEGKGMWSRVDWRARQRRAAELLARVGAAIDVNAEAASLSMAQQQLVEIARALGADAKVLILDEPTASLSEQDAQSLFRVIRGLRQRGAGVIYISHRLEELAAIADRVTVLRDGSTIETRAMPDVRREDLVRLMVGRELAAIFPKREVPMGEPALELRRLRCEVSGVHDVSLSVRAGEILGLAGLVGAGRTELAHIIFGLTPADGGEIRLRGKPVRIARPADAVAGGIAYLPEDRKRHGVVPELAVSANISLASLPSLSRLARFNFQREREMALAFVQRLAIKAPSVFSPASALSGGNQQKVALSRWLATHPAVLILDEPTQGIDVGSKAEIHALMGELAARGVAILMISSELPEILGMSDRIAVMAAGTIAAVLGRGEATQENVLSLALGHLPRTTAGAAPGSIA